jgi:hypothetical protein
MPLTKGHRYTWNQVLEETGADATPPYYLPHAGERVVAACLTFELNPDAPSIILAGNGREIARYADLFCAQQDQIPVCVKSGDREWLCCEDFKLSRTSTDPAEIREHSARAKRSDVYRILFLRELTCF